MAKIVVGCVARRNPDGSFLPARPIVREVAGEADADLTADYLPLDQVARMFLGPCQDHFAEKNKKEREIEMNKQRRKHLKELHERFTALCDELEEVRDDEQEALESIPECFEGTERYEESETAIESLDEVLDAIRDALDTLEEVAE